MVLAPEKVDAIGNGWVSWDSFIEEEVFFFITGRKEKKINADAGVGAPLVCGS